MQKKKGYILKLFGRDNPIKNQLDIPVGETKPLSRQSPHVEPYRLQKYQNGYTL